MISTWLHLIVGITATSAIAHASAAELDDTQFVGPGDRPSVCLARAKPSISTNISPMTKLAKALRKEKSLDEVGVIQNQDGTREILLLLEGDEVESKKLNAKYQALFDSMSNNFYTPTNFVFDGEHIIARPGFYYPGILITNSGPWCGGTDEQWQAEAEAEFSAGVALGGPIFYAFSPSEIELKRPCSDELFLTEEAGYCDIKLNRNWVIVFQYFNNRLTPTE